MTMDGNKLIVNQKAVKSGEKDVMDVREFTEDGLTMKWTAGGVTCTQLYKRTQKYPYLCFIYHDFL